MKNLTYILLLLLLFSCQNKKKQKESVAKQPTLVKDSISVEDAKAPIDTTFTNDTTSNHVKHVGNILKEKEVNDTYQMKSISELWKQYKNAKALATTYIAKDNLDSIIIYLNIAADASYELKREDIATWQLNNIGYHSIIKFKKLTDYNNRIQQLATITNLKKKGLYTEETKSIFRENYSILTRAEDFLYKAQLLDSELEKSERTETIVSNLKFIEWIGDYISDGTIIKRKRSAE